MVSKACFFKQALELILVTLFTGNNVRFVNEVNSNQKFDLIRKSILSILQTKNAYDIMPLGKRDSNSSKRTKSEAPGSANTGGFLHGEMGFFIENLEIGNIVYVIIRVCECVNL